MKWLDEIIDRVNAAGSGGEWATQSRIAVEWTVSRLGLPAVPDDEVVDLVGCLIDEVVRLRDYTDSCNTLLAERVEIECLRGLAIRAWHSFRSGLTATGGCRDGLTDGDILELVRLSNVEAAKNRERDVLHDCRQGKQRCHECPDVACADNMSDAAEVTRLRAENADLRQQLIDAGVWDE